MERRKEESVGDVLLRYLRQMQLEAPLNEHRLLQAWPEVVGEAASRYTESLRIYNQKLYVQLRSPALRSQLLMQRTQLVRQLNERVGSQVITDICFN